MISFRTYFNLHVRKVRIIVKSKSPLMKIIAGILWLSNKLGITNIQDFMGNYATTIHDRIYWPSSDPYMDDSPRLFHELTHVLEWHYRGVKYDLEYIFSRSKRTYYETVCVQTNMLINPKLQSQAYVASCTNQFANYGIPKSMVRKELNNRLIEAVEKRPQAESSLVAAAYRDWKMNS